MEQSESIAELTAALLKAKAKFKPLTPDKVNPHFKSKYASLNQCLEVTEAGLSANGLLVTQWLEPGPDGLLALATQLQHESGEWQRSVGYLPVVQANPQAAGSAITYARRYGYCAALGLAPDEDDDGNVATVGNTSRREEHRTPAAETPQPTIPDDPGDYIIDFGKYSAAKHNEDPDKNPGPTPLKIAGRHYAKWMLDKINGEEDAGKRLTSRDLFLQQLMTEFLVKYPLDEEDKS